MVSFYAFTVTFVSRNSPFWYKKKYKNCLVKQGILIKSARVRTPWTPPPWIRRSARETMYNWVKQPTESIKQL